MNKISLQFNLLHFTESSLKPIGSHLNQAFARLKNRNLGAISILALTVFGLIAYFYWNRSKSNAKPVADWNKILLGGFLQSDHGHLLTALKTQKTCKFDYILHFTADLHGPDVIFHDSGPLEKSEYKKFISDPGKAGLFIVLRSSDKETARWEEPTYVETLIRNQPTFGQFLDNPKNEMMILNQEERKTLIFGTLPQQLKKRL